MKGSHIFTLSDPGKQIYVDGNRNILLGSVVVHKTRITDPNIVFFIPVGDVYLIRFNEDKYLYNVDIGLRIRSAKFAERNKDNVREGLKWDITPHKGGFMIENQGSCLTFPKNKFKWSSKKIRLTKCNMSPSQIWGIKDVELEDPDNDPFFKHNRHHEQKEGPTIMTNFHGTNSKKDPYMYGNAPFRGKYVNRY